MRRNAPLGTEAELGHHPRHAMSREATTHNGGVGHPTNPEKGDPLCTSAVAATVYFDPATAVST